ncbi:GNAT family N-acetyltransferase [Gymnodinialimonas sp. 2305UL16-5]
MDHPTTTLRTERLTLRPLHDRDAEWIATEIARPDVHRMLTSPPYPYRLSDAETWLKMASAHPGHYAIVVHDPSGPKPSGVISLHLHETDGEIGGELGYWLAQSQWGNGYMTEAARAVLDQHFAEKDADVPSGYIEDNPASCNVLTKLGFRENGVKRRVCHFRQSEVTIRKMRLTASDWAVARSAQG